ncbi:hypothetical protein PISL3812_05163 [Talaromyces islandicus]|uniref:Uncharacterized protein n=1 Tax=Talaromyces islandicus TaxID=28573 RepID=A0A0U1LZ28_TALIS|nr:hypothetical protein PISL3812_05163 [Talaromyces islandicus]
MKPSPLAFSSLCRAANPVAALRCPAQRHLQTRISIRFKSASSSKVKYSPSKPVPVAPRQAPTQPPLASKAGQHWRPTPRQVVTPEKILIYHGGTGKIVFLGVLRTATLFICGASTMIIAPAFFADEFPAYLAPLIVIGGALPLIFVAYTTAPFVNNIYLHLPPFARKSREVALQYAKDLPSSAVLSIRTMKMTTIPRVTEARISDLVPDKALVRPVSFRNQNPASAPWWKGGTLKQFYVTKESKTTRGTSKFFPEMWQDDQSKALPLTNAEIKLIALGVRFTGEGGKMDYEKIAHYGGYTKGSAQVLYRKAHRKLLDAFPDPGEASYNNTTTSRGKAGGGSVKKRKTASAPAAEDAEGDADAAPTAGEPATPGDGSAGVDGEARTPTKSPVKRQRKSPVKKTAAESELKKEEQDSDVQNDMIKMEQLDSIFTAAGM